MLFLLCIGLSILILLPITKKCEIRLKSGILGSISIGLVTGVILYFLVLNVTLSYLQLLLLEIALVFIAFIEILKEFHLKILIL